MSASLRYVTLATLRSEELYIWIFSKSLPEFLADTVVFCGAMLLLLLPLPLVLSLFPKRP